MRLFNTQASFVSWSKVGLLFGLKAAWWLLLFTQSTKFDCSMMDLVMTSVTFVQIMLSYVLDVP